MRISDWSSDVCSSDLHQAVDRQPRVRGFGEQRGQVGNGAAALLLLAADIDLHEQLRLPARLGAGLGERPHERRAVDRVDRDRKSAVSGKSVSVRVDLGGRRMIKKKKD